MQPIGSSGRVCVVATAIYAVVVGLLSVLSILVAEGQAQTEQIGTTTNALTTFGADLRTRLGDYEITVLFGAFVVIAVTLILNAVWLYRASANAALMHPSEERITPGWSIG